MLTIADSVNERKGAELVICHQLGALARSGGWAGG